MGRTDFCLSLREGAAAQLSAQTLFLQQPGAHFGSAPPDSPAGPKFAPRRADFLKFIYFACTWAVAAWAAAGDRFPALCWRPLALIWALLGLALGRLQLSCEGTVAQTGNPAKELDSEARDAFAQSPTLRPQAAQRLHRTPFRPADFQDPIDFTGRGTPFQQGSLATKRRAVQEHPPFEKLLSEAASIFLGAD